MDLNHENETAERLPGTVFDAHKAFVAHAFALREEDAKLVEGLFEAGVEAFRSQAGTNSRIAASLLEHAQRQHELSGAMAAESMKAYAACLRAFFPQQRQLDADNTADEKPPTLIEPVEDYDKLSFEEIAARLIEEPEAREAG